MKPRHIVVYLCIVAVCSGLSLGGGVAHAQDAYLLGWGRNADGQASPVPLDVMMNVDSFSAGHVHSLAAINGRAYAWGANDHGQLNVPITALSGVEAVAAGETFSMALKTDGSVLVWGSPAVTNIPSAALSGVDAIAAGDQHALALKDGEVIAWGVNTHGQCNVPVELTSGVSAISAGLHYSMALKDGAVHVFGIAPGHPDEFGIRDVPVEALSDVTAISAGSWHALALRDGGVMAWGAPQFDATLVPPAATSGVAAISAGYLLNLALKTDGSVVVWGDDTMGQSPPPSYTQSGVTGISAGGGHCLVLSAELPPRFLTTGLPFGYVAVPYDGAVVAAGEPAVHYRFAPLPHGSSWLSMDPVTGELSGIPPAVASYPFWVAASNVHGQTTSQFNIAVFDTPQFPPVFVTTSPLPSGTVGAPYSLQILASNNPTFSIVVGEGAGLPPGLNLSSGGLLSGTPTSPYNSFFMVRATNTAGASNRVYSMTITLPTEPPVFHTESPLPGGVVNEPYSVQIVASNNPSFSLWEGSLPAGLGLTVAGAITGTPVQIETAVFTIRATNNIGSSNRVYELQISGPPVFVTESPLPDAALNSPYSLQLEALGDPSYSLVAGALPSGVDLSAAGLISGTPTQPGPFTFTVRATNSYGWQNREFGLTVQEFPVFTTTSPLPNGMTGDPYSQQLEASGNPDFLLHSGALPPGLNLSLAGLVSGTPTQAGSFQFEVRATNAFGWSNRLFDLDIEGYLPPRFLSIRNVGGNARLEWENLNPGVDVQVWRATNITTHPVWINLGTQTSPWTNLAPPRPSYYQLRLEP